MRVPREKEAGPDRGFPEPDMTASFHQNNSMQDSCRSPARDTTEEINQLYQSQLSLDRPMTI